MVQAFPGPQDVVGVRRWRVRCGLPTTRKWTLWCKSNPPGVSIRNRRASIQWAPTKTLGKQKYFIAPSSYSSSSPRCVVQTTKLTVDSLWT